MRSKNILCTECDSRIWNNKIIFEGQIRYKILNQTGVQYGQAQSMVLGNHLKSTRTPTQLSQTLVYSRSKKFWVVHDLLKSSIKSNKVIIIIKVDFYNFNQILPTQCLNFLYFVHVGQLLLVVIFDKPNVILILIPNQAQPRSIG